MCELQVDDLTHSFGVILSDSTSTGRCVDQEEICKLLNAEVGLIYVAFVTEKVAMGQAFLQPLGFHPSVPLHPYSIFMFLSYTIDAI
jgi:hypothetical protein